RNVAAFGNINTVSVLTVGGQAINGNNLVLASRGVAYKSNAANWTAIATHAVALNSLTTFQIISQASAPPGSVPLGSCYIINGTPGGAWAAQTVGTVAYLDGASNWEFFVPPANAGWLAYVQAENIYYRYIGSGWRSELAANTTPGIIQVANASDQAAGTATASAVTPAVQQNHHSAVKAWVSFVGSTGVISASYNISSITRNSAGNYTTTFTVAMTDINYAISGMWTSGTGPIPLMAEVGTRLTTSFQFALVNSSNNVAGDPTYVSLMFAGN
ncbi:MAG: DUF2793 domain-containing protein, partial [Bradyrhizobium sp.]|nr:DUF2793 domain-containing protein [Bradyrhizobium sp.]